MGKRQNARNLQRTALPFRHRVADLEDPLRLTRPGTCPGNGGASRATASVRHLQRFALIVFMAAVTISAPSDALTPARIDTLQAEAARLPLGERIAFWAETFIGTPYDDDLAGLYVSRAAVVADDRVDCMYLVFRAVELALSSAAEEAIAVALDKRFSSEGTLRDGKVSDYRGRFRFGEDMILSGKWGREVTPYLGTLLRARIRRTGATLAFVRSADLLRHRGALRSGDIVYFVNPRPHRPSGAVVRHMGIIKREKAKDTAEKDEVLFIHAQGVKGKSGAVAKVPLGEYLVSATFKGAAVTRLD